MTGELDGRIAIVTGTSRGVGVGIAHELLRAGATVIGCSRSALSSLPGVENEPDWVNGNLPTPSSWSRKKTPVNDTPRQESQGL